MTGGLLIQSPHNDLEDIQCMTFQHFQNRMKPLAVLHALLNMYMYKLRNHKIFSEIKNILVYCTIVIDKTII